MLARSHGFKQTDGQSPRSLLVAYSLSPQCDGSPEDGASSPGSPSCCRDLGRNDALEVADNVIGVLKAFRVRQRVRQSQNNVLVGPRNQTLATIHCHRILRSRYISLTALRLYICESFSSRAVISRANGQTADTSKPSKDQDTKHKTLEAGSLLLDSVLNNHHVVRSANLWVQESALFFQQH